MQCFYFAAPSRGEGCFVKQAGPTGRFARIVLILENAASSRRGVVEWQVDETAIPVRFRDAVTRGLGQVFETHYREHLPEGLVVRVIGGAFHSTDSDAFSFSQAATAAFVDAVGGKPVTPRRTGRAPNW